MSGSGEGLDNSKSIHDCKAQLQGTVSALAAKGFGDNARSYEAHRPGYTERAVKIIAQAVQAVSTLGENIQYQVLEIGAGTGKLTEQLVKQLPTSSRYLALDPSRSFLEVLKEKSLGVETVEGSADHIPLPDSSVQVVVCAQSFHWFSDVDSLKSIHRVLTPGGALILVWNKKHYDEGWRKRIIEQRFEIMRKVGAKIGEVYQTGEWKTEISKSPLFSLTNYYDVPIGTLLCSVEDILSNVSTVSVYNMLPAQEREAYLEELRTLLKNWPGADPNKMEMPISSDVFIYHAKK